MCFCSVAMSCDNLEYTNFETHVSTNLKQAMRSFGETPECGLSDLRWRVRTHLSCWRC
ncbi:hypothetical protein SBA3_4260008 [Candidatus Sulfopaludibacter sp. SbA3]|nr:hypothetical protein SBA3_4260008 [Candidatus Sulfopaludibacter sp. SbA3]